MSLAKVGLIPLGVLVSSLIFDDILSKKKPKINLDWNSTAKLNVQPLRIQRSREMRKSVETGGAVDRIPQSKP